MNNNNYLPTDLMSLILSIRTEEMKKDKEIKENKENYNNFVKDFKEKIYEIKNDILRDTYGSGIFGLYGREDKDCSVEHREKVLDKWELWEIEFDILSPIEDEEPLNNLNYM